MRIQFSRGVNQIASFLKGRSRGQAIILIALAMVGLLAATGLAVDGALVFARRADLRRAVDAAALAGVVELAESWSPPDPTPEQIADGRAQELLAGNGIDVPDANINPDPCPPDESCMWTDTPMADEDGAYRFKVEASMAVPLTFMNVIGINTARVSANATAEYFPQADLFASGTLESGVVESSVQSIFGPNICTGYGDAYTPTNQSPGVENPWYDELDGTYHYRIRVPKSFVENYDKLRVELLDPDSYNAPNVTDLVVYHQLPVDSTQTIPNTATFNGPKGESPDCPGGDRRNGCLLDIPGETGDPYPKSPDNEFWFHRMDEIRGSSSTPGQCTSPSSYIPESGIAGDRETSIRFTLFYYKAGDGGAKERVDLAQYTGPRSGVEAPPDPPGPGNRHPDANQHCTDLHWVSPGARQGSSYGYGALGSQVDGYYPYDVCEWGVPADGQTALGSTYSFAPDIGNGDFEILMPDLGPNRSCDGGEMDGCVVDPLTEDIFVYLDVRGMAGGSENGFELWAGPDLETYDIPTEVNRRNVYILTNGLENSHSSKGVVISGLGHLPLNSNQVDQIDIPLMYVGPQLAGQTIEIRLFDPDSGSDGPITFFFDTIPMDDWSYETCDDKPSCPYQYIGEWPESPWDSNMNDHWTDPPFSFTVPSESDSPPVLFVGGRLYARYEAGFQDTYSWFITVDSRPYLIQ